MNPRDPALIRGLILFVPIALAWGLWLYRRPDGRTLTGAFLGFTWMLPAGLALHALALRYGLWRYDVRGGSFYALPVDIYLGWAVLWGAVPILAFRRVPLLLVIGAFAWADLLLMPAAFPVVRLGPNWLIGEGIGLAIGLVPATLLARWTADDARLAFRTLLQCLAFAGLALVVIPAVILARTHEPVAILGHGPTWLVSIALQLLFLPAIIGLSAVQEFVTRGAGTPLPWDPPRRLVTTGPYAYLANPMQATMTVLMAGVGLLLGNWWVAAAAVIAAVFGIGFAAWQEHGDLRSRFGSGWDDYRESVRFWIPRWRPRPDNAPATLYFADDCAECSGLARWLQQRDPSQLELAAAHTSSEPLRRLTYVSADGHREQGVNALGRALEHINVALAFVGWAIRLPVISQAVQLLTDAVGGGPRDVRVPAAPR